ncbi:TPA: hypothetical protein DEP58_05130 [Patescibacteria group bacterium]|nr:MAG: hypothetical protein UU98_C0036G0004 [Parcubacteria group bacterium GW2011_GWD2_42_14]HCC05649.1 hypothetical protein [Patescibacteria group bacterium]
MQIHSDMPLKTNIKNESTEHTLTVQVSCPCYNFTNSDKSFITTELTQTAHFFVALHKMLLTVLSFLEMHPFV